MHYHDRIIMTTTFTALQDESADDGAADRALHAVADGLTGHGFNITGPAWGLGEFLPHASHQCARRLL